MLWWMGKKMAALHEALACTLPKKSLPTLMTPHVSQYFLTSYKDNASGSPQGSFSAFCASTVSLVFCSICPTRTGGLKIRATHPASCAAPYVSKGCASWQNRTERTLLAVGGQRSWENWGGSQGSRGKKKKSPKCGRESWQKWKGGCWAKHALAPAAQSLQYVALRICGCVYKTCRWLACTKDVASSYQKNVGFSLAEEGEYLQDFTSSLLSGCGALAQQNGPKARLWPDRLWFLAGKSSVFNCGRL